MRVFQSNFSIHFLVDIRVISSLCQTNPILHCHHIPKPLYAAAVLQLATVHKECDQGINRYVTASHHTWWFCDDIHRSLESPGIVFASVSSWLRIICYLISQFNAPFASIYLIFRLVESVGTNQGKMEGA